MFLRKITPKYAVVLFRCSNFSTTTTSKPVEEEDPEFTEFITEQDERFKEMAIRFEREWKKLYEDSRQKEYKLLGDALNEYEKKKVEYLAEQLFKLGMPESQYFIIKVRDQLLQTTGFNPLKANMNWPIYKQLEQDPFPYLDPNIARKQEAVSKLWPIGLAGFGSLLGGTGMASAAPQAKSATPDAAATVEVKEEKKEVVKDVFEIELSGFDAANKIKIIKEVRQILGLGLKEAKDLVEKAPVSLKSGVKKEEADELVKKLTTAGCKITLK